MKNIEIIRNVFAGILNMFEEAEAKASFFRTFRTIPSTYFGITVVDGSETIRTTIFNAHVVRDNYGRIVVVTERYINGEVHYIERSLFHSAEIDITDDVEDDILYSGSIEDCWYRWYQLTQEK